MSNQSTQIIPNALIIIPKDFYYIDNHLAEEIVAMWKKDGKVIKIIQLQEANDYLALEQLIIEAKLSKNHPLTIMFEDELSNTPHYSLLWTILGTLLIADLITITIYHDFLKHYYKFPSKSISENQ